MKSSTYSIHYEKLRKWLKLKREEKGLSLRDVASIVDRHHSIVGKMEQDRRKIDVVEFVEYCIELEIDPLEGIKVVVDSLDE